MLKYLVSSVLAVSQPTAAPMVTIEIVSKPGFFDLVTKYFYWPALVLVIVFIIYRKLKVK
ncbi:MAG: hypothetical protein A2231_00420 [Candidatus Firestonebacteria bacterium RIFOXYA2_FULL_40_8]|nr:MAG: hypothetical protein A2231_00420 [Candidatus Firestonebacteria bacterium RIFOXYA2_FULL_40_8]